MIDPPLTALRSFVADQQGMVKTLDVDDFRCHNKEHAKAIATLVERSQTVMPDVNDSRIWMLRILKMRWEPRVGTVGQISGGQLSVCQLLLGRRFV